MHLRALSSSVQKNNSDLTHKKDENHCVAYDSSDFHQESSLVSLSNTHNVGMCMYHLERMCFIAIK